MALKPWYKIATLRREVREGRSFSPDEFAIALEQVVAGTAPNDYSDSAQFFSRTCFTRALKEHAGMVLRRLSGKTENTAPVLTLITQFGGGKTHTLTALYHLANAGADASKLPGVANLLGEAGMTEAPSACVGVFVGNAWDPMEGRETPWIDLARQLAGDQGVAVLGPAAQTTPPGTESLARVFAAAQAPVLLLFDEVLNFVNRHRGMAESFHAFLQNLTVAVTGTTRAAAVISLPRSQVEMTDLDQQSAVVARTPLFGTVQGPYTHALVESSRGENVIELILSGLRGLPRCEIGRDIPGIFRQARRRGIRPHAVRVSWPHELQAKRVHSLKNGTLLGRESQLVVVRGPIDDVEIAGRQYSVSRGISMADERSEIRDNPVRRPVQVADLPLRLGRRVWLDPSGVHRYRNKRLLIAWNHSGGSDRPDATDGDLILLGYAYRKNPLEPLDFDSVGQFHDHRPSIIKSCLPRFAGISTSNLDLWRHFACFLQQGNVRIHLQQFVPRLLSLGDVPTHNCRHSMFCVASIWIRLLGELSGPLRYKAQRSVPMSMNNVKGFRHRLSAHLAGNELG